MTQSDQSESVSRLPEPGCHCWLCSQTREFAANERRHAFDEVRNGVCLRCGSGVLASGEHIRDDLPPCYGKPAFDEERND